MEAKQTYSCRGNVHEHEQRNRKLDPPLCACGGNTPCCSLNFTGTGQHELVLCIRKLARRKGTAERQFISMMVYESLVTATGAAMEVPRVRVK